MIVGVDNGLDGGLCAISRFNGDLIDRIAMPTRQRRDKKEVDTKAVHEWLCDLHTPFVLAIEEPLRHAPSAQSIRSMAISFGKLLGMAESHDYNVVCVQVNTWQKKMLGRVPKNQTKKVALKLASELEPDESWLANKRCRTPHDGIIDAFLIAHYYKKYEDSN